METSHSLVSIQHQPETTHSHHFPPEHTPFYLHKISALLLTIFLSLHTLLASALFHADRIICLFQIHKLPENLFPICKILCTNLPYGKHLVCGKIKKIDQIK